jgi:ferredoxin
MPQIIVIDKYGEPHEAEVSMGETLIDAVLEAGIILPASCGRGCQCGTCVIQILEGHQNLTHLDEEEVDRAALEGITLADPADPEGGSDIEKNIVKCRLSCACQVNGDLIVAQPEV